MRISLSVKYVISTVLILLVVMGMTLFAISKRHEQLVMAQIQMQAKALFRQIVITRRWIADHGGVYVEQLPWVKPNPYLPDSTMTDAAGRRYVKENPAMVTKQLSLYAQKEGLYLFHITSLKLVNRDNAPDEFETQALRDFETAGVKEAWKVEKIGTGRYFRYIAPLYVEEACLRCHAQQGYRVGDVRGGISVSMPMDDVFAVLKSDRDHMIAGGIGAVALLVVVLLLMTRRMVINPVNRLRSQMAVFSDSGSSDIPLIRTGDELEDLSRSFNDMAKAIDEYQSCLQKKIGDATRELTEKNAALLRLHATKSDFIARISHELRTPLTSIKGAMDYLSIKLSMRESDDDRDLQVFFEVIKKNADRLMRMVQNVLDYERIELGKLELHFREVNLKESFQETAAGFLPLAEQKGVQIRLKAMDVVACVDEDRVKQVLTNLLSNALRVSPEGSRIVVTLACRDAYAEAAVEDRGCGVRDGDRELIFKEFYTKDSKGGTGLGLAICKSIVEAHDGKIGVETPEGGGSRFWFRIPKMRTEEPKSETASACR